MADGEAARLESLRRYHILDTPPEAGFDDIVRLASWTCDCPVSLVSLVSFDRQWFKARVGSDACETPLDQSICVHVVAEGRLLVIPDLTQDPRTRDNPLVTGEPGIRFYAGAPLITPTGEVLGALCVIDDKPRPQGLDERQSETLRILAGQVMTQLELRRTAEQSASALLDAQGAAELREQFIAVLGHDLRNPLAAIASGVRLLQRDSSKARADQIAGMMAQSVSRMSGLIDNVLDFARGRLGGGIPVHRRSEDLPPLIGQVVDELRSAYPDRVIEVTVALPDPVDCDGPRIGQLLSNLVGNACTHGQADTPVVVRAGVARGVLEISVSNGGAAIDAAAVPNLFRPFSRGAVIPGKQGLGLGLFIASEIAKAHDGRLSVASSSEETRFTFRMPVVTR